MAYASLIQSEFTGKSNGLLRWSRIKNRVLSSTKSVFLKGKLVNSKLSPARKCLSSSSGFVSQFNSLNSFLGD